MSKKTDLIVTDIFQEARKKGLKRISIRIYDNSDETRISLHVGHRDRFGCPDLKSLLQALKEHKEDLSWMN